MYQALRRHLAFSDPVFPTVVMPNPEPPALEQPRRDGAEVGRLAFAALGLEDANALLNFVPGVITPVADRSAAGA
jgi:hypothetical protein